ncbi:MAG: mobile mystery protein A [Pseudobdellovibrionaceae bacterium]
MKQNKSLAKTQRRSLDEKLKSFREARTVFRPKAGWIKAIRESLGMTSEQLAQRMGIQQSGVILLEQREVDKKVTLETLQRAAQSMGCDLVYAIVPKESLEKIVTDQSKMAAKKILQSTLHTMALEQQGVGQAETDLHFEELALELKNKLDKRLWSIKK